MKPFIVAINAVSGGGKTTITRELHKKLQEVTPNTKALYFDDRNYDSDSGIEDTCDWIEAGADVNLFNLERLAEDIENFTKEGVDIIVMDYPFGYRHKLIGPYIDNSVFIDTPLDVALARRTLRDFTKETAVEIFDDMRQYLERGRNAYLFGLDDVRKSADFVVDGSLSVEEIVKCIYEMVAIEYTIKLSRAYRKGE